MTVCANRRAGRRVKRWLSFERQAYPTLWRQPKVILKYELDSSVNEAVPQDGDWWTLCYDTETEIFYVDHEWNRADPSRPDRQVQTGIRRHLNAGSWRGRGSNKLASGMARLRDRALARRMFTGRDD